MFTYPLAISFKKLICLFIILFSAIAAEAQLTEVWAKRYKYASELASSYNSATALVVDAHGNTYVTGYSIGGSHYNNYDYATIKYDPQGNELWVKRYTGTQPGDDKAIAIALDGHGNVYVTGYSQPGSDSNDSDYATIKYDSGGNQLWVKQYSANLGPYALIDRPSDLEVDFQGNIYITGSSTVVYDTYGNLLWHTPGDYNEDFTPYNSITIDKQGNVYVANGNTIKYNSQGNIQWQRYNDVYVNGVKVDEQGNVYVIGTSLFLNSNDDYQYLRITIKYDPQGNLLWKKQIAGFYSFFGFDVQAKDLVLDGQGNLYATGENYTYKYDTKGNLLWGKSSSSVDGTSIQLDSKGNVMVTGIGGMIKYNYQGGEIWTKFLNEYYNIASFVDAQENVYVTGTSSSTEYQTDYLTKKYVPETVACSSTGTILREYWANVAGVEVSAIPLNAAPSSSTQLTSFEAPTNAGNNYGQRIRGYICVPQNGAYTFYIAGDDNCELYLSTDDDPSKKTRIAHITGGNRWTFAQQWDKLPSQKSAAISLVAGKKYYIEALHKEGLYSDNLAVGWQASSTEPITVIPGSYLSPYIPQGEGKITREYWANVTGSLVSTIPVNTPPTTISELTIFETATNSGNNYGQRIRGYVHPQVSGTYRFFISGDDRCELYLSTDEDPDKKTQIASVPYFTLPIQWDKYSAQQSVLLYLVAGRKYYMEALHKEGLYSDNLAVGWSLPNQTTISVIGGPYLSPFLASPTTGIARVSAEESLVSKVSLYPNPFDRKLTFTSTHSGKIHISIVDNLGRTVYQTTTKGVETELPLGSLKAGVYVIKASFEDGTKRVFRAVKK